MNPENVMWTEKYRPSTIDGLVGDFKDKIRNYLKDSNSMQHLLLSSKVAGTGKTSVSKVIINELGADKLVLNSSDDRKIETIREKVNSFVKTKSSKPGVRRIVFMDEADGLTNAAQDALRNLMETYSSNAIFILTCNYISKISDAIKSRCVNIEFSRPKKSEILNYLKMICENENLEYTDEGLMQIIGKNYPSIRNCVQVLQSLHVDGKAAVEDNAKVSDDIYNQIWDKIVNDKDWKYVKDYVFDNDIDVRELNGYIWHKAVENSYIKLIQVTASNEDKFVRGGEPLIIFVSSLLDMVK